MVNIDEKKLKIKKALMELKGQIRDDYSDNLAQKLKDLEEDISNDFYTIVVLGEFKRGKSTFVNALLKEEILPMDVIPTTATISALMWSEEKNTEVVRVDGKVEHGESSLRFLNNYTADKNFDVNSIKYLKVGLPAEILKNNIVIVDTPGVSDINEQRVQVTYDFIPRADSVIFLLDSTSPLKRTEKEFIDEHIVKLGIDRVTFIANKFDNIDEEEEDDVIEDIERRLKNSFKKSNQEDIFKEMPVIPMSSSMALKGIVENDKNLIERSGIVQLRKRIEETIQDSSMAYEKLNRHRKRAMHIVGIAEREINNKIKLHKTDLEDLEIALNNINGIMDEECEKKEKVNDYIDREKKNIISMVSKSLDYFESNLKEEIDESIELYRGGDFKDYVEKRIPIIVKKNINRWLNTHYISIDKLVDKLEKEIAVGLTNYFKAQVTLKGNEMVESNLVSEDFSIIDIEAEDISGANITAGFISAGAVGAMSLLGLAGLAPFMTMGLFPVLQRKLTESKLEEVKISVKPKIDQSLYDCFDKLKVEIIKSVEKRLDGLKKSADCTYDQLFSSIKNQIQLEIDEKKECKSRIDTRLSDLEEKLVTFKDIRDLLCD